MDFLRLDSRKKILRTRLYGDQNFSRFELEVLHTPLLQRLYNLKQLGFADRVYPDAIHSRFNHVLGATEMVERMAVALTQWLLRRGSATFTYAVRESEQALEETISAAELAELLKKRIRPLRLMGLLHDLTHTAYGHTLEDEVNVFAEKHDDPQRQARFFNALVGQMIYLWATEERLRDFDAVIMESLSHLSVSPTDIRKMAEELAEHLSPEDRRVLAERLRELEFAFLLLSQIEFVHGDDHGKAEQPSFLAGEVASIIDNSVAPMDFVLHRDVFMIDLVGNTVCADLLDYARRDADNAGLRVQFDDRFLRYLGVVSVRDKLSPTRQPCVRTAIQIFTNKMRHDVLSEMSAVLKARYIINERVLFHPTKCAAGAMLGTAVQMLGLAQLPGWMQVMGDQEFLRVLGTIGRHIETLCHNVKVLPKGSRQTWADATKAYWTASPDMATVVQDAVARIVDSATEPGALTPEQLDRIQKRVRAARNVLWRLNSRRFPKLAFRIRDARHTGGASDETIARTYSAPQARYTLERTIEDDCNLPTGSIFVHCPKRKTSLKVAEALVVGSDLSKAAHLRNVTEVSPEGLGPYEHEIVAIEEMYRSIWQFHVFLDPTFWHKQPIVDWALSQKLGFPNDQLLVTEFADEPRGPYHLVAGALRHEIAPRWLPEVVERVDEEIASRARFGEDLATEESLRAIIREVQAEIASGDGGQLPLPGIGEPL
jgi:HD superfamily phosphohydrolase